jgi:hydroxyethylthiazole kinase-like uncharacterized protein yjeF
MKVCSAQQMREMDRQAINEVGIPGIVLMENAAIACVSELEKTVSDFKNKRIGVFCGKGNNGGDGFAIARHLINRGIHTTVFLVCGEDFSGDALTNFQILQNMKAEIVDISQNAMRRLYLKGLDIAIDAIFGTGIHGELHGSTKQIIEELNELKCYRFCVDIPSGVNADTGEICAVAVKADLTVTFAAYKRGLILYPGANYAGKIKVVDISIPKQVMDNQNAPETIEAEFVKSKFPTRTHNSQKGNYGKVFVVGGSIGMTGAAYLSSQAALVSGSGLVTLGIAQELNPIMEQKLTEVMTLPLPCEDGHISEAAIKAVLEKMNQSDVILFGPGIGRGSAVNKMLRAILEQAKVPVIIDADGLNALSSDLSVLDRCTADIILTPHSVEFSRLSSHSLTEIESDRIGVSRQFCEEYGLTLILKGNHTVVTDASGLQYINMTGNPGMATGGSGDVLAGMLASLVGRGIKAVDAAALSVYLHGRAGDIAAQELGIESVTACKLIEAIPKALCSL